MDTSTTTATTTSTSHISLSTILISNRSTATSEEADLGGETLGRVADRAEGRTLELELAEQLRKRCQEPHLEL